MPLRRNLLGYCQACAAGDTFGMPRLLGQKHGGDASYTIPCSAMNDHAQLYESHTILHYTIPCSPILYFATLYGAVLYCTALYSTRLCYAILDNTIR